MSVSTEPSDCAEPCTTRRAALALGAAASATALLSGCSVYGASDGSADTAVEDPAAATDDAGEETGAAATGGKKTGKTGGVALAKTADIPVGSGKIFAKKGVVVTQPTKGKFVAFSTVCTHQGCAVEKIADGTINCLCHGSKFKIADGSVADGPAPKPLPAKQIKVSKGSIKLTA